MPHDLYSIVVQLIPERGDPTPPNGRPAFNAVNGDSPMLKGTPPCA